MIETNMGAIIDSPGHERYTDLASVHQAVIDSGGVILIDVGGNKISLSAETREVYKREERIQRVLDALG